MRSWACSLLAGILLLVGGIGCSPPEAILPKTPTPLPPTSTTTPSPVWFPPTATSTAIPTHVISPTPTPALALGDLMLSDDFEPPASWQTYRNTTGSVAYEQRQLTLAINTARGYLTSLRNAPEVGDAYIQLSLQPNLCQGQDAFGVLIRAIDEFNAYRWVITCQGQMRLERLQSGRSLPLSDWIELGEIQVNPLVETRLAVWMYQDRLRLFVNGFEEVSLRDPVFVSGRIGVFARAAGDTALSVSFRRLRIYAINPMLLPTATPTLPATLTPGH
ncbi:MAG: hypothetical protein N3A60_03575 [Thermanaerothrix sp.]|nr:hypothetical protein [Thermanaerothrix sp.]